MRVAAVELQHSGANSYYSARHGNQIYGAVDGENALGMFVPAMPEEVIVETIEAYADAAAFAKFCGFGMVTVHAGHGWLLSQFLDPTVNDRKDRWGGSVENRCRIVVAIVRAHQAEVRTGLPRRRAHQRGGRLRGRVTASTRASRSPCNSTARWT